MTRWIGAGLPLALFALIAWFLAQGLERDPREIPSPLLNRPAPTAALERLALLETSPNPRQGGLTPGGERPGETRSAPWPNKTAGEPSANGDKQLEPTPAAKLYAGKIWMLNVWGSWCSGCQVEHPLLNALAAERLLPIVGLAWKDSPEQARQWLDRLGNPYTQVLLDLDGKAAIDWGVYGAPETFVIDAQGIVRFKHVGPLNDEVIRGQVRPLLARLAAS